MTMLPDDIDNQGAAHLARLADEDGLRTIGALFILLPRKCKYSWVLQAC